MNVYLDHAASSPMRPEAIAAWTEAALTCGNASSLHTAGRRARRLAEEGRERLAAAIGAAPAEVVLTSGGTEADNLGIKGIYRSRRLQDPGRRRLLLSGVEHHAVLDAALELAEHEDAELVWLKVDGTGRLDLQAAAAAVAQDPAGTALVACMLANNEVGTVQPVADLVELAHGEGLPVHVDAVQAVGSIPVDLASLGADAVALSAHKLGGPLGVGALVLRRGVGCLPLLHGGGQENGLRSGTLDVPSISAFSVAAHEATQALPGESVRLAGLRDALVDGVREVVPSAVLNGVAPGPDRLPGNAHLTFSGCEGDSLLYLLDAAGVQCSTGSACQAGMPQPSHVLLSMGMSEADARGSLRFSLGHTSSPADVAHLVSVIGAVVERARTAGLAAVGSPG